MIKYLNDYIIFFEQNKEEPTPPTPTQPDNEIWYYASSKASLYKTTNVIEHTFAEGKGVLKFANALTSTVNWFDSTNITGVSLPNTITSLGGYSFYNCYSLGTINIPSGLISIGNEAFVNCWSISMLTFPESLTSVSTNILKDSGVKTIMFNGKPSSIASTAFNRSSLTDIYVSWSEGEVANAPWGANNATIHYDSVPNGEVWYYAPEKVELFTSTGILEHNFENGKGVLILQGTTSSTEKWFCEVDSITSVKLPKHIKYITDEAFLNCTSLLYVELPSNLESIAYSAFNGCENLSLTSLPDSVTSIGDEAFMNCSNLALTSLPDGITEIRNSTFTGCSRLALTSLPDGVTVIGDEAFYDCANISLTTLPSEVTYISNGAFGYCCRINITELPASVTTINNYAFEGCDMKTLRLNGTPSEISEMAFMEMNELEHLYVPWSEGEVENAPWGVDESVTTIYYNS